MAAPSRGDTIQVGDYRLEYGISLLDMEDSSHLLSQPTALRARLQDEGYLLLRGVLDVEKVRDARGVVTDVLCDFDLIDESKQPRMSAQALNGCPGMLLTGFKAASHNPKMLDLIQGERLASIMSLIFDETPATFDTKWIRTFGKSENTGQHTDFFRFADHAQGLHTVWVPLGDYTINQGGLAVCSRSHMLSMAPEDYTDVKMELPPSFSSFFPTATWYGAHYHPGDMVVFDIRTVHASTANLTNRFRISVDTRWQPAAHVGDPGSFNVLDYPALIPDVAEAKS